MKTILAVILCLLFVSCTSLKVNNRSIEGVDEFEITLNKVFSASQQSGWGVNLVPTRGHTFLNLDINIKNAASETKEIDFNELYLIHLESRTKYPLVGVYKPSLVTLGAKSKRKIDANESLHRKLLYSFPQKKAPDFLMYREKLIPIDIEYE